MKDGLYQKLLVIGMGSKSDMPLFEGTTLDGKTIDRYFHSKHIRVYHQATPIGGHSPEYMITSIHRTTLDAIGYAGDMKKMVVENQKVAAVFAGGLAFALPGVMAAESAVVPVIAVPMDEDAFHNTYLIPDGSPVGNVEVSSLRKGLLMAERILNYDKSKGVNLIVDGNCKSADGVRKYLKDFIGEFKEPADSLPHYDGLTVCLSDRKNALWDLDAKVELGIFGLEKNISTETGMNAATHLENSLIVGRPVNLALYAARIVGLSDNNVMKKLLDYRMKEAEKYPKRLAIQHDLDFV